MSNLCRVVSGLAMILLWSAAVRAEGKVSGTVTDASGTPLADVVVRLEPLAPGLPNVEAKTKKKGQYLFALVRRGQYKVQAVADGKRLAHVSLIVRDIEGRTKFEQAADVPSGAPPPQFDLADNDSVSCDLTLSDSTAGGGELGTGVPLLGSGEIVELIQSGQVDKARSEIDRSLAEDPKRTKIQYLKAFLEMQAGHNDAALTAIDAALALEPDFPGARLLRGAILEQKGDVQGALAAYHEEAQTTAEPGVKKDAYVRVAVLAKKNELKDETIAALKKILEIDPGNVVAYGQLVDYYSAAGDDQALLGILEAAPEEVRNDPMVHFNLGAALYNANKPDAASASFQKVIELKPDLADAHKLLGYCQVTQGDLEGALVSFRRYLELAPNASDVADVQRIVDGLAQKKK